MFIGFKRTNDPFHISNDINQTFFTTGKCHAKSEEKCLTPLSAMKYYRQQTLEVLVSGFSTGMTSNGVCYLINCEKSAIML